MKIKITMDWERKKALCNALNNGKYEEAVEMLKEEEEWDPQMLDMFITGYDLTKLDLLAPIVDRILKVDFDGIESFRSALRFSYLQIKLKEEQHD